MKPVYLDYNATTPVDPRVAAEMWPFITEHFGNPSSTHHFGAQARNAVDQARGRVASLLACQPNEIVFTGQGGSVLGSLTPRIRIDPKGGCALAYGRSRNANDIPATPPNSLLRR